MLGPTSIRLGVMMFLQFFIWGAWYVAGPNYLGTIGFGATDFGWMYSVGPIAGMISPFFVGLIADRFFSTERVLAFMHLLGGLIMLLASQMMQRGSEPSVILLAFFAHMLCYFPTLALTNTLAMRNVQDSEREFPVIRVFGTIGWIAAGILLDRLTSNDVAWSSSYRMFDLAGGASILLAAYSLTLPHTPPTPQVTKPTINELLGLDAFALFKNRSYAIFMFCSFLICIPLAFYYQLAQRAVTASGLSEATTRMTYGQMSEILFMVLMPLFFKRLGVKWMLVVGMAAWVLRYCLFAVGTTGEIAWMMILGVVLHGICYDFFFVTGQIYTDSVAPRAIRGQAQGMLVLFTLGLGMLIGAQVAGRVEAHYTPHETTKLQGDAKKINDEVATLEKQQASAPTEATKTRIAELKKEAEEKNLAALRHMDWRMIWAIPAVGSFAAMLIFLVLFKPPAKTPEMELMPTEESGQLPA